MLQAVERERGTIKYSTWGLCDMRDARKSRTSQGSRSCMEGCVAAWVGWEVTIGVTIHDGVLVMLQTMYSAAHQSRSCWLHESYSSISDPDPMGSRLEALRFP